MQPGKVLDWILLAGVVVVGIVAVRHFWPKIETQTETIVLTDSAQVQFQKVLVDSLEGVIQSMKVERKAFALQEKNKIKHAVAFYQGIIDSLEAKGETITLPQASASENWSTSAEVRSKWTDGESNINVRDTTILLYGTTQVQYAFPPINQFTLVNEVQEFEIPYPVVRTTVTKTESRVSWEWIVIPSCLAFAAGMFLARE